MKLSFAPAMSAAILIATVACSKPKPEPEIDQAQIAVEAAIDELDNLMTAKVLNDDFPKTANLYKTNPSALNQLYVPKWAVCHESGAQLWVGR